MGSSLLLLLLLLLFLLLLLLLLLLFLFVVAVVVVVVVAVVVVGGSDVGAREFVLCQIQVSVSELAPRVKSIFHFLFWSLFNSKFSVCQVGRTHVNLLSRYVHM